MPAESFTEDSPSHELFCLGEFDVFETLIETTMSMITAALWVRRGAAAVFPEKYDVDEDELARISKLAKLQLEDAKEDLIDANSGRQGQTETEDSDVDESEVKAEQSHACVVFLQNLAGEQGLIDAQRRR